MSNSREGMSANREDKSGSIDETPSLSLFEELKLEQRPDPQLLRTLITKRFQTQSNRLDEILLQINEQIDKVNPVDPELVRALIYQYPFQRKNKAETDKIESMLRRLLEGNLFTFEMLIRGNTRTPFSRLIMHDLAFVEMLYQKKIIRLECFADLDYTSGLPAVYLLALKKAWILLLNSHRDKLIPFAAYFRMPANDFRKPHDPLLQDTPHAFDFICKNAPEDFFSQLLRYFEKDPEAVAQVGQYCDSHLQLSRQNRVNFIVILDFLARNLPLCNMARALNALLNTEPHDFSQRIGWVLKFVDKSSASQPAKRDFIRHFLFTEINSKNDLAQLELLKSWFSPRNSANINAALKFFFVTHFLISAPDTSAFDKLMKDVTQEFQKQEDFLINTPAADEQMSLSLK